MGGAFGAKKIIEVLKTGEDGGGIKSFNSKYFWMVAQDRFQIVTACSFRNVEDDFVWAFAGVYGPNLDNVKSLLLEELVGLISWWDLPRFTGSDFNVTHFPSKRTGGACLSPAMTKFLDFISEQGLMDLPLAGGHLHGPTLRLGLGLITS